MDNMTAREKRLRSYVASGNDKADGRGIVQNEALDLLIAQNNLIILLLDEMRGQK